MGLDFMRHNALYEISHKDGFENIVRMVDRSYLGRNPITGPLIRQFPPLKSLRMIANFDEDIELNGLGYASHEFLKTLQFGLSSEGAILPELKAQGSPLIVISTHQGLIEPIYISALLEREDSYIIAGMENHRYGGNLTKHLLPVRPSKFAGEKRSVLYGPQMTTEEIQKMNEESLQTASERVASGSMLTIFPWGGRGEETGEWYTGLGRIIYNIPLNQRGKTRILPIYFSGHDRASLKELIQELLLYGKPKQERNVLARIGAAPFLDELVESYDDPHAIINSIRVFFLNQFSPKI
ncbi:hypothetical protein COY90_00960 [Candidatus Roizmanbacteria bacterium CG_4_10_14_0_8_um_filter_39_9]|uniref:Phospholipid/glycerol acyltransferase domain-containing protein n=1 Tax=Candidatus Roizmanbacteria bacterium CG_4_10_14_0_8_um_filter_39_9 TaxID=1974829 RepID=A0A2M7QEP3_9BACT|nr:MAG: hypothetical protein COY90_00960 [Candidatus Roizmanbacteria bacterium CG_4_10_14_0_8_um_filter_39_9]